MAAARNAHFPLLENINRDLSGEVNFPTALAAAAMVRDTLRDPAVPLEKVAMAVGVEPLIASKLLRVANSAAFNPGGQHIADVPAAIHRLGFAAVRALSLAVAMEQMLHRDGMAVFGDRPAAVWTYTLRQAAVARVLARRLGGANPDQAMLAAVVRSLGIFYLFYRAATTPDYRADLELTLDLVHNWEQAVGLALLHALELPEAIVTAVRDCRPSCSGVWELRDILHFSAVLVADSRPSWLPAEVPATAGEGGHFSDLLADAQEDIDSLRAALGA